jgi:hypothetical protein
MADILSEGTNSKSGKSFILGLHEVLMRDSSGSESCPSEAIALPIKYTSNSLEFESGSSRIAAPEIVPLFLGSSETRLFPITTLFAEPFGASERPVDNSGETRPPRPRIAIIDVSGELADASRMISCEPNHCELAVAHISQFNPEIAKLPRQIDPGDIRPTQAV